MSKAIIAVVTAVMEIPGADKIHVAVVLAENVIVSKDVDVGYVGVFFPAETQLSEDYCRQNNLYRHSEMNSDNTKTGFFDTNRRVRAQPFLKVKSQAYFADIRSLDYLGKRVDFPIGTLFDEIDGKAICCKFVSQATRDAISKQNRPMAAKVDYAPHFEKHVDSQQFKHEAGMIPKGSMIHFHAKVHGTSHRSGYTQVAIQLPKWRQFVNKIVNLFPTEKWDYVVGTRNVVLTDKGKEGFHGSEQFRFDVAEMLKPFMVKGLTVYGEIAGYANSSPIMAVHSGKATKDKAFLKKYGESIVYKYGCKEHEYRFHIYRITQLNTDGVNADFTESQLEQWCVDRNLIHPLNVADAIIYDGNVDALIAKVDKLVERSEVLGEDYIDPTHPSEGVILRIDTGKMKPYFLKSKAHNFRVMEGMCEAVDTEDAA